MYQKRNPMSNIRSYLVLFVSFLIITSIQAGPKEGIMAEFRAVEEAIRKKDSDEEILKKNLEENLLRAMKQAIVRRFYLEQEKYLADLSIENLAYENPTAPNIYYVKYKYFIVRFDFPRDPERYVQAPSYEKFLIMDEALKVEDKPSGDNSNP